MVEITTQLKDIDEAISTIKSTLKRMENVYEQLTNGAEDFVTQRVKTKRGDYITIDEVRIQLLNDIADTSKKLAQMVDIRVNNEKKTEELAFIRKVLNKMNPGSEISIGDSKVSIEQVESMIEKDKELNA